MDIRGISTTGRVPQAVVEQLLSRVEALEQSQRNEDVDAFVSLFADDAVWVTGSGVRLLGKDEIAQFTRRVLPGAFAGSTDTVKYRLRHISELGPGVYLTGVDQIYVRRDSDPRDETPAGRPTYIWHQDPDGSWLMVSGQNTAVSRPPSVAER